MSFQLSFFSSGVGGGGAGNVKAKAWVNLRKKSVKHTEYFVIVQSKGNTVCIYLYCIYVRWLLCDTTFYLYYG